MFIQTLTILLLLVGSQADTPVANCKSVLKQGGASDEFAANVGHGIHSITVEELQKFGPNVTVQNRVPTINHAELEPITLVFLFAPDLRSNDSEFRTEFMRSLDMVLSHIDDRKYYENGANVIEQIVHNAHMKEHWAHMLAHYQQIKENPPVDENFCPCALDIENNGVLEVLFKAALRGRNFSLQPPPATNTERNKRSNNNENLRYSYLNSVINDFLCVI